MRLPQQEGLLSAESLVRFSTKSAFLREKRIDYGYVFMT